MGSIVACANAMDASGGDDGGEKTKYEDKKGKWIERNIAHIRVCERRRSEETRD